MANLVQVQNWAVPFIVCSVYGKTSQFYKALVSLDMSAINIFEHDAMSAHLPIISQPKQQNVCICIFIVS